MDDTPNSTHLKAFKTFPRTFYVLWRFTNVFIENIWILTQKSYPYTSGWDRVKIWFCFSLLWLDYSAIKIIWLAYREKSEVYIFNAAEAIKMVIYILF